MSIVASTALTLGNITTKHFDEYVPRDIHANVAYRADVLRESAHDKSFSEQMKRMCAEDPLFYICTFCFSYSPKDSAYGDPRTPFTLYDLQCETILEMLECINKGLDCATPKSRGVGASWMCLTTIEWCWHFRDFLSFLMVSRKQDLVDDSGNSDALFWKIDYMHRYQPRWLLPTGRHKGPKDPNRKLLRLVNADNKSAIVGESTTGNIGVGGRHTAIFFDEFALLEQGYAALTGSRDVTNCRLFNSTPRGQNHFHDVCEKVAARVIRLHWTRHDLFKRGLYTMDENGEVTVLDDFRGMVRFRDRGAKDVRDVMYPDDYPFQPCVRFKLRSPWFDWECTRCASDQEISQELEIDFLGSDYQFFSPEFIQILIAEYCMPPVLRGRLNYDPSTLDPYEFEVDDNGPLEIWFGLTGSDKNLSDKSFREGRRFGLGADVSFGTGASNSAASIVDLDTGRKVALWKDPNTPPDVFADESIALAKWFGGAYMIWDASGPSGKTFTNRVMDRRYSNVYYRSGKGRGRAKMSDVPGYFLNDEDRAVLLRDYRWKLQERRFVNVSESGLKECLQFMVQKGGKVEHSKALNSPDPRGAREAHGDEAIADALAGRLLTFEDRELKKVKPDSPWMSPAWRFEQEELLLAESFQEDW